MERRLERARGGTRRSVGKILQQSQEVVSVLIKIVRIYFIKKKKNKKPKWSSFQFINSAFAGEVTVFSMVPAGVPEQDFIGLGWIM